MKVKYVDNERMYVISNHAVARNGVFRKVYYQRRLKSKIFEYLSPLCEILAIKVHRDQFQLVVKLGSRATFERYFLERHPNSTVIPATTYIFSQVMANLQSGIAIHFNRKEDRTGAVFARRFVKIQIDGAVQLKNWLNRLREGIKLHHYRGWWLSTGFRARRRLRNGSILDVTFKKLQGQLKKQTKSDNSNPFESNPPP